MIPASLAAFHLLSSCSLSTRLLRVLSPPSMEWHEARKRFQEKRKIMQERNQQKKRRRLSAHFQYVESCACQRKTTSLTLKRFTLKSSFSSVKNAILRVFPIIRRGNIEERRNMAGHVHGHLPWGLSADRAFASTDEECLRLVAHPQIAAVASCSLDGAVNVGDSVLARRLLGLVVAVRLTPDDNVGVEEGITSPSALHTGVYNVHGGPQASRFIINQLFPHLDKLATEQGGLSANVIKRAFESTEQEFLRLVKGSWIAYSQIASVGSCCLVGAISGDLLYVANLGDYRSLLGRRLSDRNKGPVVAQRLTTDHNVAVEEVRKEIEALHRGVWRIKDIIQVSRSIGDVYLKKPEFHRDPLFQQFGAPVLLKLAVMTGEPTIQIIKLRPQDLFLIFASDGLWEQLSDEEVVDLVFKAQDQ